MIEVELPDGRILEIEAGDDRAAARAAKAFLDKERGVTAPRGGAASIGFTPSSFMALPEAPLPPQRPAPDLPLPPTPDPTTQQIEEYAGPQAEQTPLSLRGTRISEGIGRLGFAPDRSHELLAETARPLQMDSPESFGGQRITYDEATGLERAGDQLRSGWETFKQGLAATRAKSMMEALALADKADGGASPVEAPLWAELSPEQRQGLRDRTERALGSAIQSFITSRADQQEFLRNPNVQALAEAVDSGRYRDAWRILSSDFGGIVQQASVESLPSQIPGLVGALAGGVVARAPGMLTGQFLGGYAADVGPRFVEALSRRMASEGVDGEDGAAVETWLRGNMGAMREEFQAAQRGGFGPALADTASLGLARGLRPGAGVFRNTMTGLRNMGIEIGTEGAGEAAAGIFAEGKVTPSEVLMEMLGAGPQAVGTTAIATLQEARDMRRSGAQAIEPVPNMTTAGAPRPTAAQMADEAISQTAAVAAPGSTTTINVGGQVRTMTPAPGSAGGTGAAAVPPAAPPSGEPSPPPGATLPFGTPPGGAAVPTVTPDNTRPSLEQALNTPTPTPDQRAEQAAQEEAQSGADRAAGVQRIAGSLPPGWTVDDEDQIIQVYDPNGMPVTTLVRPPATEQDFAALMTGIAAQNQEGVADGSYPQPNQAPPAPDAPVAPVAQTQAEAPTPAPTTDEPTANNLTEALGGASKAIGENLRNTLWEGYSANTGAMRNDLYVQAARYVAEQRGSPLSRDEFLSFAEQFAAAGGDPTKRSEVLARWVRSKPEAQAPEAPATPAPKPKSDADLPKSSPPAAPEPPPTQGVLTPRIEGAAKRLNITLSPGDVAAVQALMAEEGLSVDAALRRMAQEREAGAGLEAGQRPAVRVSTPTGSVSIMARPEVVDASTLIAATGDLQNRDRQDRDESERWIARTASILDPAKLMLGPESDRGAPIVNPDNIVESGNGRVAAIVRAFEQHPEKAQAYVEAIQDAGYDTGGMKMPVLIRRRVSDLTADQLRRFVVDSNRDDKMRLGPVEQARQDAKVLTDEMLALLKPDLTGGLLAAGNQNFVQRFMSAAVSDEEMNTVVDDKGNLSPEGERRITGAILARAYADRNLLSRALERTDDDSRAITSGLVGAAPAWVSLRAAIERGEIQAEFDITKTIIRAADLIRRARDTGQTPAALIKTADMLNPVSPLDAEAVRLLTADGAEKVASATRISARLREYVGQARTQTTDGDLVGGKPQLTPEDAMRQAREGRQGNLLGGGPAPTPAPQQEPEAPQDQQPAAPASANTIFTEDAAAKARARLKAKLNRLNTGLDPETMQDGITLAGYHIEKGARSFAAYMRAMIEDMGEVVRPYLKSWYLGVKFDPRAASFTGMSSASEVEAADVDAAPPPAEADNTTPADDGDYGTPAQPNVTGLGKAFARAFLAGQQFATIAQARTFANGLLGGAIDPQSVAAKLLDEAIEAGVVLAAREIVARQGVTNEAKYRTLVGLYGQQPKLAVRTADSIERQAYSTPAPLAFVASRLAQIGPKTAVLEPSAGTGMLLIEANPKNATANEIDADRAAILQMQGFKASRKDASDTSLNWPQTYGAVIANPPFGAVRDGAGGTKRFDMGHIQPRYVTGEVDHAIALHALEGMRDDGAAVLILGGLAKTIVDPQARADGYNGKAKREFFYTLYNKYNVVEHVTVAGELYQKQGAGWPVDVIVIRGRGKSAKKLPSLGAPRVLSTWDAVGALLNERYDNAKPVAADTGATPGVVPTGQQSSAGGDPAAAGGAGGPNPDGSGVSANPDGSSGVDGQPSAGTGANAGGQSASAGNGTAGAVDGAAMVAGSDQLGQGSSPSGGQPDVAGLPESGGGNAGVAGNAGNRPGSRESDSANLSGGVDQAGVPANSQSGITGPQSSNAAAPIAAAENRKPRQTDEATEKQVPYEPRADADGVGTLVPVNMRTAVQNALRAAEQRAGMPLVEFVSDRLGYSVEQTRQYFSAEQIDALALGIVNLDKGAGFVIGDQTGVGKGRFVAGMIRYALKRNLIPVFVTEKDNLYKDMARDLTDIGMEGALKQILPTNAGLNLSLGDEGDRQAPRLKTPDAKKHLENLASLSDNQLIGEQKIIFTTYSQMQQQGKGDTPRVKLLQSIAPRAFLILDESHNAGGAGQPEGAMAQALAASSEKKGKRSRGQIFRDFVKSAAAVVYSSATWAKRPDVLDLYGAKTDMRLAVASLDGLAEAIRKGGVPMQQIVSAMLADAGQYMRRERTFAGVSYELEKIAVNRQTYDDIATVMQQIFRVSEYVKKTTKNISDSIKAEAKAIAGDQAVGAAGAQSTGFGAIMHNLIGQMLLASKAEGTVSLAVAALERGEKPVIALANTMGSFIEEYADETNAAVGDPLNLNFNSLLMRYLERTLRLTIKKPFTEGKAEIRILRPEELGQDGEQLFNETARLIESLDLSAYPVSPIDYLRSQLMERGYKVAEITGREHAVEYRADGKVYYRKRSSADKTAKGKNRAIDGFNSGTIDVMILNQSGATGLSLHASAKFKDQRKRIMLIAQAEANIDTHMQMLGRVHRTGQVLTPSYLQLVADVPAERRPAAVLAKKMASLSAATTSNRRGTLAAEDTPDFLNEYGDEIVIRMLEDDRRLWVALGEPKLEDENGGTLDVARQVTGRIPMLPLKLQEEVYQRIEDEYRRVIAIADEEGTNRLEAKTLELDARKLEEAPWTDAKSTESGSQFAAGSTIGKYSVKRLIPPAPPGMVVQRIADSLGVTVENAKSLDADGAAAQISILATQGNTDWKDDKIASVQAQSRRAMEALDDQDLSAKERQLAEGRVQGQMDRLIAILREAHPGAFIGVTENGVEDTGLVLAINAPKAGNSNAPSAWEMVVLLQSGRRITTALSGVFTPENRPTDETLLKDRLIIRELAGTVSAPAFFAQLEENAKGRREERYIITGNLLAAYARREGQIINFYDSEGEIRQGIMLPASFDLEAFERDQLPRFMSDEAAAYLTDPAIPLTAAVIQTSDGQVQIARNSDNSFVIRVPSSKKEGAVWFLDQRLRLTLASQFVSRGDTMVARIPSSPQRALEAIGLIATGQRLDLVSKATEAKAWIRARRADKSASEGGIGLYANPFDPALFMRLFGRPAARAVRAAAAGMRERNIAAVKANWAKSRLPPGVVVDQGAQSRDLLPLWSTLQRPSRMFRKWPALAALVDQGIAAERRMNNWQTRMNGRLDVILRTLEKQKGDRAKVAAALFDADANEVDIARKDVADKHFAAHDLSPAEATAARELNALVRMSARLVDNHRRAMMPKVRKRKREIWNVMNDIMDRASVKSPEYKKLYARRGRLNAKIRNNVGDLAAHAAEIESINTQLRMMRAADPQLQERMAELQTEYDALEARLANTSVQRRVGYFPHKFFGSWRMFEIEGVDEETGEPIRREITSDQGFYDTEEQAVEAARAYLVANPGANLRIERKVSMLPSGAGGAVLSDAGYSRLRRGLEEQTGIEGQELSDMLSGVARRRSRRRVFAPGMFRTGAEGFSEDIQRVLRTHISQSVRYVEMDKLKFAYVATTERLGLSPSRAQAIKMDGKAELLRALESWWTDVNGNKQQSEEVVDGLLHKLGLPGSTMAAFAGGTAAMGFSNPILATAFGGYLGFRMYNAMRKGGDFPTRTLMGDLTSDMAHLKLGMLVNIASSAVNLSQTLINTYPVLGEKWTAIGIKRALPAMLSQARNRDKPGMMSADAILLRRADVMTDISIQADAAPLLAEDAGLVKGIKRVSMAPFMAAEHFNRAVAFMGALARAEAKGLSPAAAFQEAQEVLKKTQFHQGIADRPELLRTTVLKLPTQFKNFMIQQIGFAFDLWSDKRQNPGAVARFLLGLFLAAGTIGILPLALADWWLDWLFGVSPIRWMKDRAIRAGIMGEWAGTTADVLMRGLPTLLQMDLSGRVGMGQGFIPNSPADLMQGPFIGTAVRLRELASNNRQEIVDYLAALSPAANPLRMLEAAANGATIDSAAFWSGQNFFDGRSLSRNPQMRGLPEYNMTNRELITQGAGFRPLRSSLYADMREIQRDDTKDRRKDINAYLQEMIQADRNGRPERIPEIRQEAAQNGVRIPPQRVRDALRDARRDRPERDLRNAPRDMRPEMRERLRGIDARELGPALAR